MTNALLFDVIKNEIIDIVGYDDVTVQEAERIAYSLDAYYVPLAGYAGVERPGPSIQIYRLSP